LIKVLHIDEVGYVKSGTYNPVLLTALPVAVVNDQLFVAIVLPARSCSLGVGGDKVTVNEVEAASDEDGLNVAVLPSVLIYDIVPGIPVPALFFRINEDVVMVELLIASLNLAVIEVVTGTPVAPFAGLVLVTVGGVMSVAVAVIPRLEELALAPN